MQRGMIVKGDSFQAVLHGLSPLVAYGWVRSAGAALHAFLYRWEAGRELVAVGIDRGRTLQELLADADREKPVMLERRIEREAVDEPVTQLELSMRIEELLSEGKSDGNQGAGDLVSCADDQGASGGNQDADDPDSAG